MKSNRVSGLGKLFLGLSTMTKCISHVLLMQCGFAASIQLYIRRYYCISGGGGFHMVLPGSLLNTCDMFLYQHPAISIKLYLCISIIIAKNVSIVNVIVEQTG